MSKLAQSFVDLEVYQAAFGLQQDIFTVTKGLPPIEKFALADQIRRSSRSIGANIAEAWAKRRYPAHFLSKLTDSDGELQETIHWLDSAAACGYLSGLDHCRLKEKVGEVARRLGSMIARYESFCAGH